MPNFKIIRLLILEKKILNAFYHGMAMMAVILVMPPRPFSQIFDRPPLPNKAPQKHVALIGQEVIEKMFKNNGHIHVSSPGAGADHPLGSMFSLT